MRALEFLGGLFVAIAIGIGAFRLIGLMIKGAMSPAALNKDKNNE